MEDKYFDPTDEQREHMLGHIDWELRQMRTAVEATADGNWNDPRSSLIAEAGLIHARCLIEFLFEASKAPRERHVPLARASWYTGRGWVPVARRREFDQRYGRVSALKTSIDRRICHLALDRDEQTPPHLYVAAEGVEFMWTLMHANLRPEWRGRMPR